MAIAAGLVVIGFAAPAVGQRRQSADEVKAAAAFDRGRALLKAGDWDGACAAFGESERLAPAVGTELNLAPCLARAGQLLAAVELLAKAEAGASALGESAKLARARADLAALRARIPTVVARVPAGRTIALAIDGAPVASPTAPTPVDPGPRVLTITWSGGAPIERTVVLAEGETLVLEAPPIEVVAASTSRRSPARPAPRRSGRRIAAYAVGGVGLAAVVGGAAALAIGLGDRADAEDLALDLSAGDERFARASELHADGTATANLGVGLLLGGGAAVVGATYLWLTGRSSTAPTVSVGSGGLLVGYAGAF